MDQEQRRENRRKKIDAARLKLANAVERRSAAYEGAESARHRPTGDPRVQDAGELGPGERSADWVRQRKDEADERFKVESAAAIAEIQGAHLDAVEQAEVDLVGADRERRSNIDYAAEAGVRAEIEATLARPGALGESQAGQLRRLAGEFERRGDAVGIRAMRNSAAVNAVVNDASLTGPHEVAASEVRSLFRESETTEYATVHAIEAEISDLVSGETARTIADEIRTVEEPPSAIPEAQEVGAG